MTGIVADEARVDLCRGEKGSNADPVSCTIMIQWEIKME